MAREPQVADPWYEGCITRDGTVRKWDKEFNDSYTNVHDGEQIGRTSVITEVFEQKVYEKVKENRRFMFSSLFNEFSQVSKRAYDGTDGRCTG